MSNALPNKPMVPIALALLDETSLAPMRRHLGGPLDCQKTAKGLLSNSTLKGVAVDRRVGSTTKSVKVDRHGRGMANIVQPGRGEKDTGHGTCAAGVHQW
jgi:hypothetical protein